MIATSPNVRRAMGTTRSLPRQDQLLGVASDATSDRCHTGNESAKGFIVARTMRMLIDKSLNFPSGMPGPRSMMPSRGMEISEAKFKLRDVRQAWLQSRTMVHSFDEEKFHDVVQKGLVVAASVSVQAKEAIDEYYFGGMDWVLRPSLSLFSLRHCIFLSRE